jgi:hypothetical protein
MFFYSNELQVGKFQVEKLVNVWRPHLKSLPLNCYMSQNKTFIRNLQTFEKSSCTNLKFDLKLNIGKEFSLTHLKLEAFNNMKNLSCTHLKLQRWNFQQLEELSSTHFLKLECWNSQQLEKHSSKLEKHFSKLEKHSSTLENLQHFEEISSTCPTHLEKLQAPCMSPLGNELPLTLQTKKPSLKRILSFLLCNTSSKPFTTSCSNTMSFLLLGVGLDPIGNNLKTSKKWKIQGSWNGKFVLTNKKITKVVCFKCYNHKIMICND